MTALHAQMPVGQLVTDRPSRSRIFERLGIDYCCGGHTPLAQACDAKGLDLNEVLQELVDSDARHTPADAVAWTHLTISALVDHIVTEHHVPLRQELPRLEALVEKVVRAHADSHPELRELRHFFGDLKTELECHMRKEENILFPILKQIDTAPRPLIFHLGSLNHPMLVMEFEHNEAGTALARLRALTDDYTPPADACNTYRALLDGLAELETDMHLHIHKENNLLFPKARDLEASLRTPADASEGTVKIGTPNGR